VLWRTDVGRYWYEVLLYVQHAMNGDWGIWINGTDNVNCMPPAGNRFNCAGGPKTRCNVCINTYCWDYAQDIVYDDFPWTYHYVPKSCCCPPDGGYMYNCEYPAFRNPDVPGCAVCSSTDPNLHCDDLHDRCYPRHQTQQGTEPYAEILFFGTSEGEADGYDYWYDDIMFNDTCPYSHTDPTVTDNATGPVSFGGRLTILRPDAPGDKSEFTPHSAAEHWQNVDEIPPSHTDYNSSSVAGAKELYNIESATGKIA